MRAGWPIAFARSSRRRCSGQSTGMEQRIHVDPTIADVVQAPGAIVEGVRAVEREALLDAPLREAAARMRVGAEALDVTTAVRTMYKRVGIDPTKTRPSSEALLRRVRKGGELPRINSLVDVINWCSLESQLPFGLYDRDHVSGEVVLRLGLPGEEYAGIRKDTVHVAGRLALVDHEGPFGNPTSDSARTMVTPATTRALVVIFTPVALPASAGDRALTITKERVSAFCRPR